VVRGRATEGADDDAKRLSVLHDYQWRAAGCEEDIRWAILGHEEETVAAGYGKGSPAPLLRKWIDKIGF
jgi:hypothetical protein